ncbi:MAG: hypothetical protein ACKO91_00945 [Acidimicrobiales bacterium]
MRVQDLVVIQHDGVMRLSFHPRITVCAGLQPNERDNMVELVHRSMLGALDQAELRYQDGLGRTLLVRRSGGRRRVNVLDQAGTGDATTPGPEDLPRVTHITARELGTLRAPADGPNDRPSLPLLVERLIGWLGRARNGGSRGNPSLAILNEPLLGLTGQETWDLLDAVERLSAAVQVVYLTNDVHVSAWANDRIKTGAVHLFDTIAV